MWHQSFKHFAFTKVRFGTKYVVQYSQHEVTFEMIIYCLIVFWVSIALLSCSLIIWFCLFNSGALIPEWNAFWGSIPTSSQLKLLVFKATLAMMKLMTTYQSSMIFLIHLRCGIQVPIFLPYLIAFILVPNYWNLNWSLKLRYNFFSPLM